MIVTVDTQELKDRILQELQYVQYFKVVAYPKKRGKVKKVYSIDPNNISFLLKLKDAKFIIKENSVFSIQVKSIKDKELLEDQSRLVHNWMELVWLQRKANQRWIGLDSDKAGILMHIYLDSVTL